MYDAGTPNSAEGRAIFPKGGGHRGIWLWPESGGKGHRCEAEFEAKFMKHKRLLTIAKLVNFG